MVKKIRNTLRLNEEHFFYKKLKKNVAFFNMKSYICIRIFIEIRSFITGEVPEWPKGTVC